MKLPFSKVESKKLRIWLRISLIPYALVILYALYGFFIGIEFFGTTNGMDGFLLGLLFASVALCIIPLLPAAVIFQMIAGTALISKKAGLSKKGKKKAMATVIGIIIIIVGGILCSIFRYQVEDFINGIKARIAVEQAESIVEFNTSDNYTNIHGMDEFKHDFIAIDYDKMKLTICRGYIIENYFSFKLKKTTTDSDVYRKFSEECYLQADFDYLREPGSRLVVFRQTPDDHLTCGFILFMADGTIWYHDIAENHDFYSENVFLGMTQNGRNIRKGEQLFN